jgi:hypothetical protein
VSEADSSSASVVRACELYWQQMEQLKASAICIRLYRNHLGRRVQSVEIIKAVASSGSIGAWVIWQQYPFIWAAIIAAAQVLDALKGVFPFTREHRAASELTMAMELLFIDAELEWEGLFTVPTTATAIMERRARLQRLQLQAEHQKFPDGLNPPRHLIDLALRQATSYLSAYRNGQVLS